MRAQHPAWGGRKIRARLLQAGAEMAPAPSTITAILRRHGEPVGAHGGGRADWTRFEQPGTVRKFVLGAIVTPMEGAHGYQEGHAG